MNEEYLNKLFEKYEISSEEEKRKTEEILEEYKEKEEIEKIIVSYSDKIDLVKQLIEPRETFGDKDGKSQTLPPILPIYYDNACIWWKWDYLNCKWEIIDEIDLMNLISFSSYANTINSKERGEILQALKQVARQNKPQNVKYNYLQFKDEIINIDTGERFKATYEYFLTNPIPYKLGKKEDTPTIDRIFEQWVGKDNILLLKEIIAFSMLRSYPIHRIFCFVGAGLNGKSCFLNLLRNFIGATNCCSTELDTLINSRFEVSRLYKKLVCQMGETNFSEMKKTSLLKMLSGGDLIGFEIKNKNPFEDINYAKIIIATNNLPSTSDKTVGFYRRWIIVDFPNQFSEKKDILSQIPEEEYENLALQSIGILINLLKKREFHNEGSIEERIKRYEDKSNFLNKFIEEFIDQTYNSMDYITKNDFYKKFSSWCLENRHRQMSEVGLGVSMKKLGIESVRKNVSWLNDNKGGQILVWEGIKWK